MAMALKTKVRFPLNRSIQDLLLKEFQDAQIEKQCIFIFSRGFTLHQFLIDISVKYNEEIIVEHISSVERYTVLYVVSYKNGVCKTIETRV